MKKIISVMIMSVLIFALTACGGSESSAPESSGGNKKPIKIGFSALPTWYLWHLVEEKGFFEKHGVDVELVYFSVYGDSVSALNTGEVDGNSQTLLDTLPALSNGIKLKSVFITDNSDGGDGLVVKPEINSIEDLRGKTVGTEIGTIAHFFLLTLLKDSGMTEKDVNFTNMTIQDAGTSFIAGQLDAAELWEPFLSKAVTEGKGKLLASSSEYPGLIADLFVMREDVVNERPEDVEKIAAAWFEALEYFNENPEESAEIIAKAAGIDSEEITLGVEGFDFFTLEQNLEAYQEGDSYESLFFTGQKNAEFLLDLEFIDEIPALDGLIDDTILQNLANN